MTRSPGLLVELPWNVGPSKDGASLRWTAQPRQVICGGMSYAAHNAELAEWFRIGPDIEGLPFFFVKSPSSLTIDGAPIMLPDIRRLTRKSLDCPYGQVTGEVELAVVIGKEAYRLQPDHVMDYVFGYSVFNDITQRDTELAGYPVCLSKGFHTFGPLGPCIVPKSRIEDPQQLRFRLSVNGTDYQKGTLAEMLFSIETLVAQATQIYRLQPGDVVTTGSPPGMFAYALAPGDVIEAEIEGIGVLRNVVAEQ